MDEEEEEQDPIQDREKGQQDVRAKRKSSQRGGV